MEEVIREEPTAYHQLVSTTERLIKTSKLAEIDAINILSPQGQRRVPFYNFNRGEYVFSTYLSNKSFYTRRSMVTTAKMDLLAGKYEC